MANLINSTYEHALARCFHYIDNRGLLIDRVKHIELKKQCFKELKDNCSFLSALWNIPVYIGSENDPGISGSLNINAKTKLLDRLKDLGYEVPKVRKRDEESGEYELKDSVNKLALQKLLSDPSLWPNSQAGDGVKKLLESIEVITFRNRYINARLYNNQYFSNHSVTSTVTGRRGSKKNIFGFGGNDQNFPARGRLSPLWKSCIIARPNRIFFFVDQMQAEDWPVQALSANYSALDDMRTGVNRHYKFAALIFNSTADALKRIRGDHNHPQFLEVEMQYNLGKRGRHANNYGMQPTRLSEILAAEGYSIPATSTNKRVNINGNPEILTTKWILETINRLDPNVKTVFHQYIQDELSKPTHSLHTPLGRERQFFGLRSGEKNYNVFNEAYGYIPQSTVGDNTGLAVLELESGCSYHSESTGIVQDGHDSLCQELCDTEEELLNVFNHTKKAFNRDIVFHNGISVNIPIEGHIGYNWFDRIEIGGGKNYTEENLLKAYKELKEKYAGCNRESTGLPQEVQQSV